MIKITIGRITVIGNVSMMSDFVKKMNGMNGKSVKENAMAMSCAKLQLC